MSDRTNENRFSITQTIAVIVAAVILAVLLYVGSYYAMVQRVYTSNFVPLAGYRFGGGRVAFIYGPMHLLDRQIRSDYWQSITRRP